MPYISLQTPDGLCYQISSRERETLRRWFDEILPHAFVEGRPIDDFEILWPRVSVYPMFSWETNGLADPDWLADSRALGRLHQLAAKNGEQALIRLDEIRAELVAELAEQLARPGWVYAGTSTHMVSDDGVNFRPEG
jgi:hypothetical protein